MTLGEKVKRLRTLRGWSQRELARQSGVPQTLLSDLETGKQEDTTGENLRKLAETLYVSIDYLVGTRNDRPCPAEGLCLCGTTPLPVTTLPREEHGSAEYSAV
jgi:transcriptional regulator with XRE-family HTH domain